MKSTVSAILVGMAVSSASSAIAATSVPTTPTQPQTPVAGAASLDERLGCGVMLVTLDEVLQRNPQLVGKMSNGDGSAAMVPMIRMLGASGEIMLDKAYDEGVSQGLKPTAMYRRGVANLSATLVGAGSAQGDQMKEQAMAMFTRCVSIAVPKS
jgi:hypothetical protein